MSRGVRALIFWLLMMVGVSALAYPFAMNYFHNLENAEVMNEYSSRVNRLSDRERLLEEARAFNEVQGIGYTYSDYERLLKVEGSNIMGMLRVPSVELSLPIFHGYDDDTLLKGVGHIHDTSLPIGGKGNHAVLTGHSGLPDQRMFDKLPDVKEGDLIEVEVLGEIIAYEVFYTQTFHPDDFSEYIQPAYNRDLLSLVTCTPYSINTHRFIATGERIDYESTGDLNKGIVPLKELLKWLIPYLVGVGTVTALSIRMYKKTGSYEKGDF